MSVDDEPSDPRMSELAEALRPAMSGIDAKTLFYEMGFAAGKKSVRDPAVRFNRRFSVIGLAAASVLLAGSFVAGRATVSGPSMPDRVAQVQAKDMPAEPSQDVATEPTESVQLFEVERAVYRPNRFVNTLPLSLLDGPDITLTSRGPRSLPLDQWRRVSTGRRDSFPSTANLRASDAMRVTHDRVIPGGN